MQLVSKLSNELYLEIGFSEQFTRVTVFPLELHPIFTYLAYWKKKLDLEEYQPMLLVVVAKTIFDSIFDNKRQSAVLRHYFPYFFSIEVQTSLHLLAHSSPTDYKLATLQQR